MGKMSVKFAIILDKYTLHKKYLWTKPVHVDIISNALIQIYNNTLQILEQQSSISRQPYMCPSNAH